MALAGLVVSAGIKAGIERLSLYGIPLLFAMLVGLMIWAGLLPDAMEGYREFLLKWDTSKFLDITTLRNAFTQAFFSLGIGVGVISAYASYLNKNNPIPKEAGWVAGMDTSVGLMAGCVTFPLVASAGLQSAISDSSVGSLFVCVQGSGRAATGLRADCSSLSDQVAVLAVAALRNPAAAMASARRGDGRSRPAPGTPRHRGPVAAGWW
jgi:NSS family neurotransmitter:Na+ symporter